MISKLSIQRRITPGCGRAVVVFCLVWAGFCAGVFAAQESADDKQASPAAKEILQKTGLKAGLAWLPYSEDEAWAGKLAEAGWQVVVSCADDAAALALHRRMAEKGWAGGRIIPWVGTDPCDRLADLVVASRPVDQGRLERALAPRRGVALVGDKLWRKPPEDGAAEWTHRGCGPDNRYVSEDKTITLPMVPQWYTLPLTEGFWGSTVLAGGGRIYTMAGSRNGNDGLSLTCRSYASGATLWERRFTATDAKARKNDNFYPGRSIAVVHGDELLLGWNDRVLRLDGETGAERGTLTGPGGQIKWIARVEKRLFVLAGDPDVYSRLKLQGFPKNPSGRKLSAVALDDGRELWKTEETGEIDERAVAVSRGRIVYQVSGIGTVCRDVTSGRELWRQTGAVPAAEQRNSTPEDTLLVSTPVLRFDGETVIIASSGLQNQTALDAADGKVLWQREVKRKGRSLAAVLSNGCWYADAVYNARSGDKKGEIATPQDVCSITSQIPGYYVTAFAEVVDIQTGKTVRPSDVKSICDVGTIVADGAFYNPAAQCTCNVDIHGARKAISAHGLDPHAAGPGQGRIQVCAPAPRESAESAADWPTARHDASRSGASPAEVGTPSGLKWSWAGKIPAAPEGVLMRFLPTAPVAAHGAVLFGSPDGLLVCCDEATGKERWRTFAGGGLFAPPVISGGLVYAGTGDGRVLCLDLKDGSPVWRFSAAPGQRLMRWYGHPVSNWPLVGGLTVHEGVCYAVAGYHDSGGLHVYALDRRSGKILWQNHDAGRSNGQQPGVGNYGISAAGDGRLWLSSAGLIPASFSLADGKLHHYPVPEDITPFTHRISRGMDVGVINGQWVLRGGERLSLQQDESAGDYKGCGFNLLPVSIDPAGGKRVVAGVNIIENSPATPAWDRDLIVCGAGKQKGLTGYGLAGFLQSCTGAMERPFPAKSRQPIELQALDENTGKGQAGVPPGNLWGPLPERLACVVLAADAVVAVVEPDQKTTRLVVLSRTDGKERWGVALPSRPVDNGIAITAGGAIVVSCANGEIEIYD